MVVLPPLDNQSCGGVEDGLKWVKMDCCHVVEDVIAIVEAADDESVDKQLN